MLAEDVPGDLDEIAVEVSFVPLGEDVVHLGGTHTEAILHDVVGLADQLHVSVFDAVVNHLHVMAGTTLAHPVTAGSTAVNLGRYGLKDLLHMEPCRRTAAGHDAGAATGTLLASGNSGADIEKALGLDILDATGRVVEEGISPVDNDVTGLKVGKDLLDEIVHGFARLHQHHHAAGTLQLGDHLGNRVSALNLRPLGLIGEELVHLVGGAVVSDDGVTVVVHVED